jgi:hypothetical protein
MILVIVYNEDRYFFKKGSTMRKILPLCLLLLGANTASAHFIWLIPEGDRNAAQMIFSDSLEADANVPISKIAQTKLLARCAQEGDPSDIKMTQGKNAFMITVENTGPHQLGGTCQYGVLTKGKKEPFLLMYHPRTAVGLSAKELPLANLWQPWPTLPLQIVQTKDDPGSFQVLWQGKPLPDAEVTLLVPGLDESLTRKADGKGRFALEPAKTGGLYGIRAGHIELRSGQIDGKEFKEVRHYATLTLPVSGPAVKKSSSLGSRFHFVNAREKADPAATRLLAEARNARAVWENFPGFHGDLEINHNGKVEKAQVDVDKAGKVQLDMAESDLKTWTRRELSSLVSHRLGGSPTDTPCAFLDENTHHPMGRAIKVLNDELHSSYRIRDQQILEVNRVTGDIRFTISVLENKLTPEKKYLPIAYVVNNWDQKANVLRRSITFHNTWNRIGTYDLPNSVLVVDASSGNLDVRQITFHNLKLKK